MPWIVASVLMVASLYTDATRHKIPNTFVLIGAAAGLGYYSWTGGWSGFVYSVTGLIAGFSFMFIMYLFKALGAGDVKLLAAVGALTGVEFVSYCIFYSLFYAGIIGVVILVVRKQFVAKTAGLGYRLFDLIVLKNRRALGFSGKDVIRYPFLYAAFPAYLTAVYEMFI
ncbi:prepilin peptidase [Paenibacillus sp. J2TS4]|uniref:A24 family peptidase n=1 Tax=Paenibacillus sp. J2TS4 TaxID=2807194 RepID=UPI001B21EBA3|nr:prepilin peptidase [Paenibacillus sp. J2TS4]GIP32682.1 hypothetical protein J2TS4_18920 [Paenibacillus sp. J2TS4]